MILKEMIDTLRMPQRMQIRDEEGWEICTCNTNSEGVLPYMNCVVAQWFGNYKDGKTDFVVYVKETDDVPAEDAIPIEWLWEQSENPSNTDEIRNAIDYIVYTLWAKRKERKEK